MSKLLILCLEIVAFVNDRGTYVKGRVIDLSRRAAKDLGMLKRGSFAIEILSLPDRDS